MKVFLISFYNEFCLGMRSISAFLKAHGHQVRFAHLYSYEDMTRNMNIFTGDIDNERDLSNEPIRERETDELYIYPPATYVYKRDLEALKQLVLDYQPDIVGMGVKSFFHGLARRFTKMLREETDALMVLGGPDPTINSDLVIEWADVVCRGDGEKPMLELCERMERGEPIHDIQNFWVREGDTIHKNANRPLEDIVGYPAYDYDHQDHYFVDYGAVHNYKYPETSPLNHTYMTMAARGCPYSCSFCGNAIFQEIQGRRKYFRLRSVDEVIDELKAYLAKHPETTGVEFYDDIFGLRKPWLEEFAAKWPKEVGLPFWCYTHPTCCNQETLDLLKQAGARYIVMGVQSGSDRILQDVYNRRTPAEQIKKAVQMILDTGFMLSLELMDGHPFHTEEDHRQTLELLLSMKKGYILQDVVHLIYYRNFPIIPDALKAGVPVQFDDAPYYYTPITPENRFWQAALQLPQFDFLPADRIRAICDDPHYREHPELVEMLCKAMLHATYMPKSRLPRDVWDQHQRDTIDHLEGRVAELEAALARVQGDPFVNTYLNVKTRGRSVARKFALANSAQGT